MLDPVIEFFERIFHAIGRGIGMVISFLLWPFVAVARWYRGRNWLIRVPILSLPLIPSTTNDDRKQRICSICSMVGGARTSGLFT